MKLWNVCPLDKGNPVGYIIIKLYKRLKCNDEESRQKVKSKASRGWCKPGESSFLLKITSELQPEI